MIRSVAVIADSHFDESSRFDECRRVHDWIADDLARRKPALILHSGDLHERKSSPNERAASFHWVQRCANVAPFAIVRGNHDAVGDLPLLERLKTAHPIEVYERCGVLGWPSRLAGFAVAMLGWPQRSNLHTMIDAYAGQEAVEQVAAEQLRNVFRGMGAELDRVAGDYPRLFLGHAMVRGSRVSTGQPLVGCDFEIGLDDLGLVRADAYLLGHVHFGQEWEIDGAPCIYPGSPRRTAFGETEPKSYVVVTFDGRQIVEVERVETPAARMFLIEDEWGQGELAMGWLAGLHGEPRTDELYQGAEVRFRYYVAPDQREAARAVVPELVEYFTRRGVVNVKVEEIVRTTTRARAPEVAEARSTGDKLRALWRARNDYPPPDREGRLISKLEQIENEVRNAS